MTPHPIIQQDLIDNEGNMRAADIGVTWEGSETFLHGVRVVGPSAAELPGRPRLSTSTPYQPVSEHIDCDMLIPRQPLVRPTCFETPDTPPYRPGRTPKLPTGGTHTALHQEVAKLAVLV